MLKRRKRLFAFTCISTSLLPHEFFTFIALNCVINLCCHQNYFRLSPCLPHGRSWNLQWRAHVYFSNTSNALEEINCSSFKVRHGWLPTCLTTRGKKEDNPSIWSYSPSFSLILSGEVWKEIKLQLSAGRQTSGSARDFSDGLTCTIDKFTHCLIRK